MTQRFDRTAAGEAGVSRRGFLRRAGVVGGAGAVFTAMGGLGLAPTALAAAAEPAFEPPRAADLTSAGRGGAKVVVIGAGVAGLCVAYELGKAGYDCVVLEATRHPGGRTRTVRGGDAYTDLDGFTQRARFQDGGYLNAGAAMIAPWMVTMDYCRELDVPVEVFVWDNQLGYVLNTGAGMSEPIRRQTYGADSEGYTSELLAKATDAGALDARLTAQDKERLLEHLRTFGDLEGRIPGDPDASWRYRAQPERRGYKVTPGAFDQVPTQVGPVPSVSGLLGILGGLTGAWAYASKTTEHAGPMFQPVGGMDRLPRALAAAVGVHRVRYEAVVTEIADRADGVAITYRDARGATRRVDADYCVSTMPPHLAARTPHNLGADVQAVLSAFRGRAAGKIGLEYHRRWWELDDDIYGGATFTDLDIGSIWYPSHDLHRRRGVLVGSYVDDVVGDVFTELPPAERARRAVASGMRVHGPKYRDELASSFSTMWAREPHYEGGWAYEDRQRSLNDPFFAPLTRPAGRVWFAGDWISNLVGWQHGALLSARRVVTQIHHRVLGTP